MVLIHVGAPKTGTTAIQAFLRTHAERMPGVEHPYPLRGSFARHLFVYARSPRLNSRDAQLLALTPRGLPEFCDRYEAAVRRCLPARGTVVSCNELLFRLDDEGVQRVAGLFGDRKLRVVLYLRRHDELAVSSFLQARKRGIVRRDVFPKAAAPGYRSVIETWSRVGDVTVRLYERALMPGGDVVRDFLSVIGVEPPADAQWVTQSNLTWGRAQLRLGGVLNRHFPFLDPSLSGDQQRLRRADLLRFLERLPSEPAQLVSREQARAYVERFRDDDEWVRRRFLPERGSLFGDDFSRYPPAVPPEPAIGPEELTAALVELWRFRDEEVALLRDRIQALETSRLERRGRMLGFRPSAVRTSRRPSPAWHERP